MISVIFYILIEYFLILVTIRCLKGTRRWGSETFVTLQIFVGVT
jgi:hypothetical protein